MAVKATYTAGKILYTDVDLAKSNNMKQGVYKSQKPLHITVDNR